MEPIKEYSKVVLSLENCCVPRERLLNTPSQQDGASHELEVNLRLVGCEYIQTAGLLLKLPQVAMATAQVIFQRFYYSKSFVKYSLQPMAMACVFLAAKIEEDCRRIRDVINVFHHLRQKKLGKTPVPMEYMGEEYFKLKATVIKYERFLLKELGFCVHVKHPHKLIITYLQMLEMEKNKLLAQRSWNYMNDSLRTNTFVRFTPETIACACIFLAARELKIPLPQSPPWWLLFDADYEDIEAISLELLSLYRWPKVQLEQLEKKVNSLKEELQKKQIEIKEVKLKKAETEPASLKKGLLPTPASASNKQGSPLPPKAKTDTQSPIQSPKLSRSLPKSYKTDEISPQASRSVPKSYKDPSPPLPPLLTTTNTSKNPAMHSGSSRGSSPSLSQNHASMESGLGKVVPSPIRWKTSPATDDSETDSHTPSPISVPVHRGHIPQAYRPVTDPIVLSEEDSDSVHSPLLSKQRRENGIQERSQFNRDRKVRKSRHKHRDHLERKPRRGRSRERERDDHRRKLHHRGRGRERERERERERTWREREDYVYEKKEREVYDKRERERDYMYESRSRKVDPYRR